jgi:hypothetical protein
MLFVNAFEGTQEITHIGPQAFGRVAMNLSHAITIIVARPFFAAMLDGGVRAQEMVIALILVGKDGRSGVGEAMHMREQGFGGRVHDHAQPDLPATATHRSQHGRTVIGKGAASAPLVGAAAWRVAGV